MREGGRERERGGRERERDRDRDREGEREERNEPPAAYITAESRAWARPLFSSHECRESPRDD